ncbi:hypothetical protein JXA47_11620 [Candidatus Sumerlaeota bacterium]|nr:hypothetical protein [Candidatus Sumerlaeota bacterium]
MPAYPGSTVIDLSNPLLRRWWRSQFGLGCAYRSQVILLGLPLLALVGMTIIEHWVETHEIWGGIRRIHWWIVDLFRLYVLLFIPIATLLPSLTLITLFQRLDRQLQFEPLLATPITGRKWLMWMLTMSAGPIAVFLMGCWVCFFLVIFHPTIFEHIGEAEWCYYLALPYVPMQCLWSAAITLHFLSRNQRVAVGCVKSLLTLQLPLLIGLGIFWANEEFLRLLPLNREILGPIAVANGLKLPILAYLLWSLWRSLGDRLASRLTP